MTIPKSVTTIGECAFLLCSSLTYVTIGNSVESINDTAFDGCTSLQSFVVVKGNQYYSSDDNGILFSKNEGILTLVRYPVGKSETSYTIPETVINIAAHAFFESSNLISVTIGDSVTNIGDNAFNSCYELTTITIPNSIISIGEAAFMFCDALKTVYITIKKDGEDISQTTQKLQDAGVDKNAEFIPKINSNE